MNPPPGISLRAYQTDDEDASVALWLRTWQATYPELDFAARLDWWRTRWRDELLPAAEVVIAEIGADMTRFPSEQQLASWAGVCPGNNESAGKHFSGKTRKGSRWLRQALVESAQVAARTKETYFSAQYARIKGRHGHKKAIVALAHSLLVVAYYVLLRNEPYVELGDDYFIHRQQKESYRRRLVQQLERMGYDVNLAPKAA